MEEEQEGGRDHEDFERLHPIWRRRWKFQGLERGPNGWT